MIVQRLTGAPCARLLGRQSLNLSRQSPPLIIASRQRRLVQKRLAAFQASSSRKEAQATSPPTAPATSSDAYSILAAQRRKRPISPHLSIYQPQVTWYLSALNRITGSMLSGGIYVFGAAYLVSPLFGWHLESAHLAEAFGSLGPLTKFSIKFLVAMPFTFHSFNGVRHLIWDTGREFGNKQVIRTGWFVVGLSVISSVALASIGTFK